MVLSRSGLAFTFGRTGQGRKLGSSFDEKAQVRSSDPLTLVSKTVQYLRESFVSRRVNVEENHGRCGDAYFGRRNGFEDCRCWKR
jgi:hypothetical protein